MLSAAVVLGGLVAMADAGCAGRVGKGAAGLGAAAGGCAPANPEPCEAACDAGQGRACAILGLALEGVADAPLRLKQDLARGRRAARRGCELGDLDSCSVAWSYEYDHGPSENDEVCRAWLGLCERGHRRSCAFAGDCLIYQDGFPKDIERGLALFQAGCAAGDTVSCRELAFLLERGTYLETDAPRAFALMQKACAGDDPLACAHLGRYQERGVGTQANVDAARKLYRASCQRGIKRLPCEALERLGEAPPAVQER
jgi:TPR repeat protein